MSNQVIRKRNLKNMKGKTICRFPSRKSSPRTIYTEGVLERDYCYHLEANDEVIEYESQPRGFFYWNGLDRHIYTPDFWVHYKDSTSKYFEIKEERYLDDEFWELFPLIQKQSLLEGIELELVTDTFIYKEPFYNNLKHLHRARQNGYCSKEFKNIATYALSNVPELTIRELLAYAGQLDAIGMVYKLIQQEILVADIKQNELGPDCLIRIRND